MKVTVIGTLPTGAFAKLLGRQLQVISPSTPGVTKRPLVVTTSTKSLSKAQKALVLQVYRAGQPVTKLNATQADAQNVNAIIKQPSALQLWTKGTAPAIAFRRGTGPAQVEVLASPSITADVVTNYLKWMRGDSLSGTKATPSTASSTALGSQNARGNLVADTGTPGTIPAGLTTIKLWNTATYTNSLTLNYQSAYACSASQYYTWVSGNLQQQYSRPSPGYPPTSLADIASIINAKAGIPENLGWLEAPSTPPTGIAKSLAYELPDGATATTSISTQQTTTIGGSVNVFGSTGGSLSGSYAYSQGTSVTPPAGGMYIFNGSDLQAGLPSWGFQYKGAAGKGAPVDTTVQEPFSWEWLYSPSQAPSAITIAIFAGQTQEPMWAEGSITPNLPSTTCTS